jgi:hypothetical protein
MYVVLVGNAVSGFDVFGPFASEAAAEAWAAVVEDRANDAITVCTVREPD